MKRLLPTSTTLSVNKSLNNPSGFTLIELLIVVAIIAVLSVIGLAIYSGITSRANDARRKTDIKAIADALEMKKEKTSEAYYQGITASDFATGVFPVEPTTRAEKYCYQDGSDVISNPAAWSDAACPDTMTSMDDGTVTPSPSATFFKVCTVNNDKTDVFCVGNRM